MTASAPHVVLLPDGELDDLARTLETIVRTMPDARVHVARSGFASHASTVDQLARAGLSTISVPAADGFPAVIAALDEVFGDESWTYLVAGEQLSVSGARTLQRGGQLVMDECYSWLGHAAPLAAPRVRRRGRPVRSEHIARLSYRLAPTSWIPCFAQAVHDTYTGFDVVLADVALLCHIGELDAAFQRAELAWRNAAGEQRIALTRATALLGRMLGIEAATRDACSDWMRTEPHPIVALAYLRASLGFLPFAAIDLLLRLIPAGRAIVYRDGMLAESVEEVTRARNVVERERHALVTRREMLLRSIDLGVAQPADIGRALECAALLGQPPESTIARIVDTDPELMVEAASYVNVDQDVDHVARTIVAFERRWGRQWWWTTLLHRFIGRRTALGAGALDAAGLAGTEQWEVLAAMPWATDDELAGARSRISGTAGAIDQLEEAMA